MKYWCKRTVAWYTYLRIATLYKAGHRPPEAEASQADAVAQSFSVGSRKEDSRSYLTDPSARACRADDQRSMALHIKGASINPVQLSTAYLR